MSRFRPLFRGFLSFLALGLFASDAQAEVDKTVHNLAVRLNAKSDERVDSCIFCHTPHNGNPSKALWNRALSGNSYKLYESPTLEAILDQPTGSSRLCLSCHDGTIALEDLRVKPKGGRFALGYVAGKSSLSTDLSDDHPVSFLYNSALAQRQGELADPALLAPNITLDRTGQLQCTSCHDPHEDRTPKFLVTENKFSQLCVGCHQMKGWPFSVHATSTATWKGVGRNPWGDSDLQTVGENGCGNCHRVHSAGRPQWLLNFGEEKKNCLVCHSGSGSSKDMEREFKKFSAHPIEQTAWVHRPKEEPGLMGRHVTCSDCHNPHAAGSASDNPDPLPAALRGAQGINASGTKTAQVSYEYEVCFACHGVTDQSKAAVIRKDHVTNARVEFNPGNRSSHPVVAPGTNPAAADMEAGYTSSSMIQCSDCHSSDNRAVRGPHGSRYEPILEREYQLQDPSPDSYQAYALCYKCHNRTSILSDRNGFPHRLHVVDAKASCATCHDAHGSRNSAYLINFMVRTKTGYPVVSPSKTGRLEFQDLGQGKGQCSLSCHGRDHDPEVYPPPPPPVEPPKTDPPTK